MRVRGADLLRNEIMAFVVRSQSDNCQTTERKFPKFILPLHVNIKRNV
jgi:hypothetical protein